MSTTVHIPKITLSSVSIESFRGYNNLHSFHFNEPIIIFFGSNGNGKSSTLYAIEWCLFGKIEFLPPLEGRARDEVINQFNHKGVAKVIIVLAQGNDEFVLERTKENKSAKTNFTIKRKQEVFKDKEAERLLSSLLSGMTVDDFIRSIYLHQDAIRALFTDDIAQRDEALDRLFGLEKIRNIIAGIPLKELKDQIKTLNEKKSATSKRIEGAITLCQSDLEKLKKKAIEAGLSEENIELAYAEKYAQVLVKQINSISTAFGAENVNINELRKLEDYSVFEGRIKEVIKDLEKKSLDQSQVSEFHRKKRSIDDLIGSIKKQNEPISERQAQVDIILSREGTLDAIEKKISNIENDLTTEKEKRNSLDVDSRLIQDAILSLKYHNESHCPVCEQTIDVQTTLQGLESRAETMIMGEIEEIDAKILELQAKKSQLETDHINLDEYTNRLEEEKAGQQKALLNLGLIVESEEKGMSELLSMAQDKIAELDVKISTLEQSLTTKSESLQKVRESLELLMLMVDVLNKDCEFGNLNELFSNDSVEIDNIDTMVVQLEKFQEQLNCINKAAGKVQTELATEVINSTRKDIERYYSELCMHGLYDRMRIDVKPRDVRGIIKNAYAIKAFNEKDKKETHVATRFSTGQMNCVALSVFFALTRSLQSKLGFIILDDPSQNLDQDHKKALACVICSLCEDKQIFISTQDKEFKEFLLSENQNVKSYDFIGWDKTGPKFN